MCRIKLLGAITVLVGLLPPPQAAGQSLTSKFQRINTDQRRSRVDRTLTVLRQLNKTVLAVEFDEEPIEDVLNWFRERGLKNIVVHWRKLDAFGDIDRSTPVTLAVTDTTLGELLDLVLETTSQEASQPEGRLFYRIVSGMIEISTRQHYAREIVVRTYPVEDLLKATIFYNDAPEVSVADNGNGQGGGGRGGRGGSGGGSGGGFGGGGSGGGSGSSGRGGGAGGGAGGNQRPGGSIQDSGFFTGGGGGGEQQIDYQQLREDQLEKLIGLVKTIRPDTWTEGGGRGTVVEYRGKLIISQTIEMHEIIGGTFRLGAGKR